MELVTKHLKIKGRVQGVGFRYSMCAVAEKLGVKGWVKNCVDGTVESMVQGDEHQLSSIIDWAKHGPTGSRVEDVDISDGNGDFKGFLIIN
jgi:acylphosphatase